MRDAARRSGLPSFFIYILIGCAVLIAGLNGVGAQGSGPNPCSSPGFSNADFETGDLSGWTIDGFDNAPFVTTVNPHSGSFSARVGNINPDLEPTGDSAFSQEIHVPAAGATLSFWYWPFTTDVLTYNWQDVYVTDTAGVVLATIMHQASKAMMWTNVTYDLSEFAGQTVRIRFLVHQDGVGDDTAMYVDDVTLITASDGTPCDDGNACTTGDNCQAGVCTGIATVCETADQCHEQGSCDPSTGLCSTPARPDGAACDDRNACTAHDECESGVCAGHPVTCAGASVCRYAGTCSPDVGCVYAPKPDTTRCNDANACTIADHCQAGVCTGSPNPFCRRERLSEGKPDFWHN